MLAREKMRQKRISQLERAGANSAIVRPATGVNKFENSNLTLHVRATLSARHPPDD